MAKTNFTRLPSNSGLHFAAMKATILALCFILAGCAGSPLNPPSVSAAPPPAASTLTCSAPAVFRSADDGVQNAFAAFTLCNSGQVSGNFTADAVYTIQHDFTVAEIQTWIGTPQGSVEETGGEITIEVPTATAGVFRTLYFLTNQIDKHADVIGSHIEHLRLNTPRLLPAGSRIHYFPSIGVAQGSTNCPASGCGIQINVYLNGD